MNLAKVLPILILLCIPTFSFGQSATNTATTTESGLETVSESWYTTDTISGQVDVGDFVVGPGRTELSMSPGETAISYLTITNRISEERIFRLEVADISGTSDGSAALRVIEGERGPYSILDYISFPENEITLSLGERARIPITVSLPGDAEPGGFYGTLLVSTIQVSNDTAEAVPTSPIIARIGSHFFISVAGDQDISGESFNLSVLPTQWWYESGPMTLALAYENTGSVHVNPYGEISVTNLFGDEVGYIELEPWFVLPQSIRTREVVWSREFLFGRYTAKATINRGYDDILDEVQVTFWVLPWRLLALIFGGLFVTIFIIRFFFRTFEFKRKS
jgi:hypothetical protein